MIILKLGFEIWVTIVLAFFYISINLITSTLIRKCNTQNISFFTIKDFQVEHSKTNHILNICYSKMGF